MNNIAEISDSTTCKHCGQSFSGPRIEILGQPEARLEAYLQILSKHFYEKHPREAQMMDIHTAIYSGLLFLMSFKTTDKELNEKRDQLRWTIHQQTLNARFSDASLKEQCGGLARKLAGEAIAMAAVAPRHDHEKVLTDTFKTLLLEVFTGMRNDLEEPGKYAVEQPSKVLV